MLLAGLILGSGVAAVALAELINYGVTYWLPCEGERLACTMDGIVGSLVTFVLGPLAMIVFGVIMWWRPQGRVLNWGLLGLAIPLAFLVFITVQEMAVLREGWDFTWRQIQKFIQIVVPAMLAVAMQWLVLHIYIARSLNTQPQRSA